MSEMHSKPGGTDQLQLKAPLPTAESMVGKDKSWPLREQLKKASKNTQQALARSLHLPSLKLTAKESPGGRKFGLCPTCKCAAWGTVEGGKSHTQALWIQRKPTHPSSAILNPYKGQELGAWLDLTRESLLQVTSNRIATVSHHFAMNYLQKTKGFIRSKKRKRLS